MGAKQDPVGRLLDQIETAWAAFNASYDGLTDVEMAEPGVAGEWSVKDILAHVTTWEAEALTYLPVIVAGGRPPRYVAYGGLDAFNALMTEQRRGLSLDEVLTHLVGTHQHLIAYVAAAPDEQFARESRSRRRLRLDTYGHYPKHTRMIQEWRMRWIAAPDTTTGSSAP